MKRKTKTKRCELCNQQASLYCPADSAFLCPNCDASVHQANFLVARHLRHLLCSKCNCFTANHFAGATPPLVSLTCPSCSCSCSADSLSSSSLSTSESCATATPPIPNKIKLKIKPKRRRRRRKKSCSSRVAHDLFVKWSRELGLGEVKGNCVASHALCFCLTVTERERRALPLPFRFRVAAATSFWLGLRFCGDRSLATFHNLTRLEAISGVPPKLILTLVRLLTHTPKLRFQQQQQQERWDES